MSKIRRIPVMYEDDTPVMDYDLVKHLQGQEIEGRTCIGFVSEQGPIIALLEEPDEFTPKVTIPKIEDV